MDQITEGLVDEDNVKDGGKIINKLTYPAPHLSVGAPFQDQEDACTQGITPEQRPPEWNLVPKEEDQQDQPEEKEKGQPLNRIDASHREKIYPKPEEKSKIPDQRQLSGTAHADHPAPPAHPVGDATPEHLLDERRLQVAPTGHGHGRRDEIFHSYLGFLPIKANVAASWRLF